MKPSSSSVWRGLLSLAAATAIALSGCATTPKQPAKQAAKPEEKNGFYMKDGSLFRGDDAYSLEGFLVPDAGAQGPQLKYVLPRMAKIAEVGGNAIAFDLPAKQAAETIHAYAARAKEQRMAVLVRMPATKRSAAETKAVADPLAIYLFEGADAAQRAKAFKRIAPQCVVAAPEGGDLQIVTAPPAQAPKQAQLVMGMLPNAPLKNVHFLLPDNPDAYARLDAALTRPEEKKAWNLDPSVVSAQERAEGFVPLFDGKSLDGWWVKGETKDAFYVSEEGYIEWRKKGGEALMTAKRYGNFVFRCDWRILPGGNSGIWFRAPRAARQSYIGFEMQMQGDNDAPAFDKSNTGAVYMVVPPKARPAHWEGLWNTLEVTCDGPHVKALINGVVVQDLNFDENEELKTRLHKGFICLTDHDAPVAFRNIRIKELK